MALTLRDDEWRKRLTPKQYRVLRDGQTEPPFSGALLLNTANGAYACAACGTVVFQSKHKFSSHSGWPSFYNVANSDVVRLREDRSHGIQRVEVLCANCGSHLGHVFNDAPEQPTGMRFCINSVALDFQENKQ